MLGCRVDLVEKDAIRTPFRRLEILRTHQVVHAASPGCTTPILLRSLHWLIAHSELEGRMNIASRNEVAPASWTRAHRYLKAVYMTNVWRGYVSFFVRLRRNQVSPAIKKSRMSSSPPDSNTACNLQSSACTASSARRISSAFSRKISHHMATELPAKRVTSRPPRPKSARLTPCAARATASAVDRP